MYCIHWPPPSLTVLLSPRVVLSPEGVRLRVESHRGEIPTVTIRLPHSIFPSEPRRLG